MPRFIFDFFITGLMLAFVSCSPAGKEKKQLDNANSTVEKKNCIEKVISIDDSLGKKRNQACETVTLSQAIIGYADGIGKIEFEECPPPFKTAFEKHRQAWIDFQELSDKYPDLRAEMHELFNQLEKSKDSLLFKKLAKQIWDTWGDIEKVMKNN